MYHTILVGLDGSDAAAGALRAAIDLARTYGASLHAVGVEEHLPHYAVTTEDTSTVKVLGTQPIDMSKPHPFTEAGNREFNSFVWMPPKGPRAGEILLTDSTVFSTLFGADDSLKQFWKNLATAKVVEHV